MRSSLTSVLALNKRKLSHRCKLDLSKTDVKLMQFLQITKRLNLKTTHGEAYYQRRANIDFTHDLDKIFRSLERLPKRMPRKEALRYYGDKLRKVFGIEEVSPRDFRHIEEFFDYYEAQRIRHEIFR